MSNNGIVTIHGTAYVTVAKRVEMLHEDKKTVFISMDTEVLSHNPVVTKTTTRVKRLVELEGGKTEWVEQTYTGISAANPNKNIEKQSPYEVAETSSAGRSLGFAGYGAVESIASVDEMVKAGAVEVQDKPSYRDPEIDSILSQEESNGAVRQAVAYPEDRGVCSAHDEPVVMFRGVSKSKVDANGNPKTYWWHKGPNGEMCFGSGYQD